VLIVRPIGVTAGAYYHPGPDPGRWVGAGAAALGLSGIPSPEALERVLAGRHPADGKQLGHTHSHRRAGWDLIFAAPKSVSLLAAVAPDIDSRIIRLAHYQAVTDTLSWVADEAAWARRQHQRVAATGITAAAFEHGNSAAGDPHLHTHVLVANLVRAPDGRWSALDGALWRERMAIGALYELALRHELATRGLALRWNVKPTGLADVVGVPRAAIDATSFRHAQVTADLAEELAVVPGSGTESVAGRRRSHFASTRTREVAPERDWRSRLADVGFGRAQAAMLLPALRLADPGPTSLDGATAADVEAWLTARGSTWSRSDAIRALAATSTDGVAPGTATHLVDELCARSPAAGRDRWSTSLARHQDRAVRQAAQPRSIDRTAVPEALVRQALADRGELGAGERALVQRLLTGNAVVVLDGVAGRDRLMQQAAVLDAAHAVWQAAGLRVAVDASAADTARWTALTALQTPDPDRPPAVLVVDRADRRTSAELAPLLESARAQGAKVILVAGGTLPARRAAISGAFEGLEHQALPLTPTGPHRAPGGPTPEDAQQARRHHAPVTARSGRMVAVSTAGDAVAAVVDQWEAHPVEHRPLMVGLGPPEVEALNAAARQRLRADGTLGAELHAGGRSFAVGDRVISRHSRPGALGSTGTITAVSESPAAVTVRWDARPSLNPGAEATPGADGSQTGRNEPEVAVVPAWDCRRLVHGYATTPKLAARVIEPGSLGGTGEVPAPTLLLGDPALLVPLAGRELSGVVVAPSEPIRPQPIDRLERLARLDQPNAPLGEPPTDGATPAPTPGPDRATVDRAVGPEVSQATLSDLAVRRDGLAARLRATLPADTEPDRRRLADDRAWYDQRSGGPSPTEQRHLAVRTDQLRQGDATIAAWQAAHRVELEEWRHLGRAMDRRAELVTYAATLDPAGPVRDLVGPEPAGRDERSRWQQAIKEVAVHTDRWPASAQRLEPDSPAGAVISFHRQRQAVQALGRSRGRDPDTGLGL
jgi:conjugative relaxase-like TrwC/TraI family protein